jgi:ABC-type branched-subunit amino acid transport system ATPase component
MHDAIVLIPNIRAMTRSVRHCCLERGTSLIRRIDNLGVGTCSWRIPLHRRGGKRSDNNLARVFDLFPSLRERSSQMAGTPWGGERRMLMLGLALMMRHSLPLMDEPSIGLAPRVTADVFGSIARLKNADVTIIWGTERTHGAGYC